MYTFVDDLIDWFEAIIENMREKDQKFRNHLAEDPAGTECEIAKNRRIKL
jgi:hypothetical protein